VLAADGGAIAGAGVVRQDRLRWVLHANLA